MRVSVELPTLGLAAALYASWLLLTAWVPENVWLWLPLAFVLTWHGSLQHETIHGHPTSSARLNALVGGLPLALWLPYSLYRKIHLAHHGTAGLTVPSRDPESFYLDRATWHQSGRIRRALYRANGTLLGRLIIGPALVLAGTYRGIVETCAKDVRAIDGPGFLGHLVGVAAVGTWLYLHGVNLGLYLAFAVYPSISLTLLRSYAEHRPDGGLAGRSAIVESGGLLPLLFLFNNLHAVHHRYPNLPWYRLRRRFEVEREMILEENGGYYIRGYRDVFRQFLLRAPRPPVHPSS
ncbi:MAG: fatty acid desaturase [Myxococcota bacterium]